MRAKFVIIGVSVITVALYVVGVVGLLQDSGSSPLLNPTTFPTSVVVFGGAGMFASMLAFIAAFLHMTRVSQENKGPR